MHVVVDGDFKNIKLRIKKELKEYGITHTTIEFEEIDEQCDSHNCEVLKQLECHHHH